MSIELSTKLQKLPYRPQKLAKSQRRTQRHNTQKTRTPHAIATRALAHSRCALFQRVFFGLAHPQRSQRTESVNALAPLSVFAQFFFRLAFRARRAENRLLDANKVHWRDIWRIFGAFYNICGEKKLKAQKILKTFESKGEQLWHWHSGLFWFLTAFGVKNQILSKSKSNYKQK